MPSTDISEATPVKLGVVGFGVMVFVGVLGFLVTSIWYASSMSTKLDILMEDVKALKSTQPDLNYRLQDHDARLKALSDRVERIDKKLDTK